MALKNYQRVTVVNVGVDEIADQDGSGVRGELGVRDGRRRLMLRQWKCAERVMLLMCEWKDSELWRMTPRLLT